MKIFLNYDLVKVEHCIVLKNHICYDIFWPLWCVFNFDEINDSSNVVIDDTNQWGENGYVT